MRPVLIIAALLLAAMPAQAQDLCRDVEKAIRHGKADGGPELNSRSVMGRLAERLPRLVRLDDERNYKIPAGYPMPEEAGNGGNTFVRLGNTGIAATLHTDGSMHCQNFKFYRRSGREVTPIPAPKGLAEEMCWEDYARAGMVDGFPAMIRDNAKSDYATVITIMPLKDGKWAKPCRLTVEYRPTLHVAQSYCPGGKPCNAALSSKALDIVQRYERNDTFVHDMTGKDAASLRALVPPPGVKPGAGTREKTMIPEFGRSTGNPYTVLDDERVFITRLDGRAVMARVGHGLFGWRDYPGRLVGFWGWSGGKLVPLAGFQIARTQQTVSKVTRH